LLSSNGLENVVHCGCPAGQFTGAVKAADRSRLWCSVSSPDGWKFDVVTGLVHPAPVLELQPGGATVPLGAPSVSKSTPAEAVVSFETTVLLMKLTRTASSSDTPAPAHPATLLA